MELIKRAWRGEERLWVVFWLCGLVFAIFLGLVAGILTSISGLFNLLIVPFYLVYIVWLWVSEWKCAFNLEWIFWGYAMRVIIVLKILIIPGLIIGGVLVGQDLIGAAQCKKETTEYTRNGGLHPDEFKKTCLDRVLKRQGSPSSTLPALPPVVPTELRAQSEAACKQTMTGYALKNGGNPQEYIASNQDYLQKCIQHNIDQSSGPANKVP